MASTTANMHEAKTHLSRLVKKALAGEEVVIAQAGVPAVRLVPIEKPPATRRIGFMRGQIIVPDDIKTPFAQEINEMFYGNPGQFDE